MEESYVLPDCEAKASIQIDADELTCDSVPFSFTDWVEGNGAFTFPYYKIKKENIEKWKTYANQLKQLGNDYSSLEERIRKLVAESGF